MCNAVFYFWNICEREGLATTSYTKSRLAINNLQHTVCDTVPIKNTYVKRKHNDIEQSYEPSKVVLNNNEKYNVSANLFDRTESYHYYNCNKSKGDGATYLVGNSLCGTSNTYEYMDGNDVTFHLLMAKL